MDVSPSYQELVQKVAQLEHEIRLCQASEAELHRLAVIIRDSNDAITIYDFNGMISAWNRGAERMYGYTEQEALTMNIRELIPPERRDKALEFLAKLQRGEIIESYEAQRLTKDGRILDVWLTVTALTDDQGKPVAVATTERDVTERNMMIENLRESSERIRLLTYFVSHDLRGPSIGVHGLVKRLAKEYCAVLDQKGRMYCDAILKGLEQIMALIDELNVYIAAKERPLMLEKVRLQEIIDALREEFSDQIESRGITWSQPESMPEVKMDKLFGLRALRNLVDNALKHGGEDLTEISIGYKDGGKVHVISVHDNGAGLPPEAVDTIFEPFHRGDSKNVVGIGLGLPIVKEVAERHQGCVRVKSKPGSGTTFFISFAKKL